MKPIDHDSTVGQSRRDPIIEEAAHWLAVCSDPTATEQERALFVAWLRRSNLHVEEFLRLSTLTQRLAASRAWPDDTLQELIESTRKQESQVARIEPPAPAHDRDAAGRGDVASQGDAISRSDTGRGATTRPDDPKATPSRDPLVWSIAAAVLLTAGLTLFALTPRIFQPAGDTYTTALGELRSVVLSDGSVVELNTRSHLRTRYAENVRLVELESGEAIFKVAKDTARPFRVVAGDTEVVAVGTQFNVYAEQGRTVVTVLEGRVRVSDRTTPPGRVELGSGEQAVIARHQPIARIALADPARVTSWTERRLIFEDSSLAHVTTQFARYSPRVIRIGNPALAARHITGVFDASDPASLVQFLGDQGDITVESTAEGWLLK